MRNSCTASVAVEDGVGDGVGMNVAVTVGVAEGMAVAVAVAVGVGLPLSCAIIGCIVGVGGADLAAQAVVVNIKMMVKKRTVLGICLLL
jgi:hypothetical protein